MNNKVGYTKGVSKFIGESISYTFVSLFLLLLLPPVGLLVGWGLSIQHCIILRRRYLSGDEKTAMNDEWKVALWGILFGPLGAAMVYGYYSGQDLNKKV